MTRLPLLVTQVIIVLVLVVISGCERTASPFAYKVRVRDAITGDNISSVVVTLSLTGNAAPLRGTTDTEGLAIFAVPSSYAETVGRLIIDGGSEYERKELNVQLTEESPETTIALDSTTPARDSTPPSTPEPTLTSRAPSTESAVSSPSLPVTPTTTGTPNLPSSSRTFTCITFSYGSYFPLMQIVQDGLDEQNGFHLELIPWQLPTPDGRYEFPFEELLERLRSGEVDCALDTIDGPARNGNYGVITAVVSESAGADQVWVRGDIETINDLEGKRISFVAESVSEFMLYALLDLVGLSKDDVILVPANSMEDALDIFNRFEADAVVGWEPVVSNASLSGGRHLVDSSEVRYLVDTITVSRQAIETKPDIVQAFHRAWFQALKIQFDDFSYSAETIAAWGNSDWTFVYPETASSDLGLWLENIAQAGYGPNHFIMLRPTILYDRLRHAQAIWQLSGVPLPPLNVEAAVDPQFVLGLRLDSTILAVGEPLNPTFVLAGQPPAPSIEGDTVEIAILPCEKFEFLPDEVILTDDAQILLDECALPILKASTLYLRIIGSSAWPGPSGRYSEAEIANFAELRATAIAQYLSNRGIDPSRLIIDFVLPPPERRESNLESELEQDRFVRLVLETTGQR